MIGSLIDDLKELKIQSKKYSPITLSIIGLILGVISLSLWFLPTDLRLTIAAFFFNVSILGFILLFLEFLKRERFKKFINALIFPLVEYYKKKDYKKFTFRVLFWLFLMYLVLLILTLFTRINFLQQTVFAIVVAANLIMASVGLTLTTRVRKFSNFAQSEFLIVGIYVSVALGIATTKYLERNFLFMYNIFSTFELFFIELLLAFVITGLVGVLSEILIFGPLAKRDATPLSLMVGSIGLGLILRQTVQEIYGSVPRTSAPKYPEIFDEIGDSLHEFGQIPVIGWIFNFISMPFAESTKFYFFNVGVIFRISRDETWAIIVCFFTLYLLQYIFTKTTLGVSMRATADDDDLAQITGINTKRVIYWTWFIAAGVTGMAGIYFFEASQIQPGSGFIQLLLIFAVVILGGFDSFEGTVISGFIISFTMTVAVILNSELGRIEKQNELLDKMVFWSTSGDWKLVVAFAIIIVVLIFRPRGIFGLIDPRSKL
jgi:branched-chain amino acid transport system permease protein